MKITREDVLRVAELAHLGLSADEIETYQKQLDAILTYVDKLNEIDVTNVEPMAQVLYSASRGASSAAPDCDPHPELRDDVLQACEASQAILAQASDSANPFFRVPKVIDR